MKSSANEELGEHWGLQFFSQFDKIELSTDLDNSRTLRYSCNVLGSKSCDIGDLKLEKEIAQVDVNKICPYKFL